MVPHIANISASKRHTIPTVLPEENSRSAASSLDKKVTESCSQEVNLGKSIVVCLWDHRWCWSQALPCL